MIVLSLFTAFFVSWTAAAGSAKLNKRLPADVDKGSVQSPVLLNSVISRIGVVNVDEKDVVCLTIKNADLAEGTPVSIVGSMFEPPQRIVKAVVAKKLEGTCARSEIGESGGETYYLLTLRKNKAENDDRFDIRIALAVIQPAKEMQVKNGLASVDLDQDGKPEYFRVCAATEGLHLTVWSGKPLVGKRIWHTYYYLGYDTEADCKKKDWLGAED